MKQHERALQELRNWTEKNGGGLQIIFAGHNPTFQNGTPHPWQCIVSNNRQTPELYHAYGVTFEDVIVKCHQRWQNQKTGYVWEEITNPNTGSMPPSQWQEFRERYTYTE